jgi:hypothetical protein
LYAFATGVLAKVTSVYPDVVINYCIFSPLRSITTRHHVDCRLDISCTSTIDSRPTTIIPNIIMHASTIIFILWAFCHRTGAFQTSPTTAGSGCATCIQAARASHHGDVAAMSTRRSFAEDLLKGSIGFSLASLASSPAYASGGATAGGAYLLSGELEWRR